MGSYEIGPGFSLQGARAVVVLNEPLGAVLVEHRCLLVGVCIGSEAFPAAHAPKLFVEHFV